MGVFRAVLNGLILTAANFAGIVVGFILFKAVGTSNQVMVQVPVAVVFSIVAFLAWTLLLRVVGLGKILPRGTSELLACWIAALVWGPLIFVPLHYFTQGYMTSAANLIVMALYQAVVNPIALLACRYLQKQPETTQTAPGHPM